MTTKRKGNRRNNCASLRRECSFVVRITRYLDFYLCLVFSRTCCRRFDRRQRVPSSKCVSTGSGESERDPTLASFGRRQWGGRACLPSPLRRRLSVSAPLSRLFRLIVVCAEPRLPRRSPLPRTAPTLL